MATAGYEATYGILYECDFKALARRATLEILSEGRTPATLEKLVLHCLSWYDRLAAVVSEEMEEISNALCCRAGCTYCCGLRIEVSAPEIFLIAKHLMEDTDPIDRNRFTAKIQVLAEKAPKMTAVEWAASECVCPFLEQGRCAIYSVRPLSCRGWSSTDIEWCKSAITKPDTATQEGNVFTWIAFGIEAGLRQGLTESGLEGGLVELNTGLDLVLRKRSTPSDWLTRKAALSGS
jgi:Fe-S-cluster containining protein